MWNETELDAAAGAEDNLPNVNGGQLEEAIANAGDRLPQRRIDATVSPISYCWANAAAAKTMASKNFGIVRTPLP